MDRINDIIEARITSLRLDRGADGLVVNDVDGHPGVVHVCGDKGTDWYVSESSDALGAVGRRLGSDAEFFDVQGALDALDELAADLVR